MYHCGCGSMAEHQLPKLRTRVRFPSSAYSYSSSSGYRKTDRITFKKVPKLQKLTAKKKKVTVTWKKITNKTLLKKAKKIQIQIATNRKFTRIVWDKKVGKKKTSFTFKGLKEEEVILCSCEICRCWRHIEVEQGKEG